MRAILASWNGGFVTTALSRFEFGEDPPTANMNGLPKLTQFLISGAMVIKTYNIKGK